MDYQHIIYEQLGPVLRLWHNRPEVRNAEGRQLLEELDHAVQRASADASVHVVIFAGKGDHFSAGHDLKESIRDRPNPTVEQRYEYELEHYFEYGLRIYDMPKPTIAQVQGACIAAGFMVANMCDLMIASDDAFFSDPTGHTLGAAAVEMLIHPHVLGMRKAKEMLFTGRRITAQEGLEVGMINHVVPRADLEAETLKLAEHIASAPPFGLRLIKRSLNRTLDAAGFRTALTAHFDAHQLSHVSAEYQRVWQERQDNAAKGGKTSFGRPVGTEVKA
ncbi:enoyl-CoA hydratase (plasmid) [Sphingomonas paeninsulae]|uniref:Enoyl-CoA hydratase n=1 Tax=Sphingomonas paeninsulae TaxID=2319844 RepID=A0A494TEH1_SPHPE|nr:enoyl-CoA hydratase [Sphingomonas paeninsulae]AYJ85443.1 enoyl-CoA hydratase [Sphingomonas paeninsulae]